MMNYEALVVGTSAGGMRALKEIISGIGNSFRLPMIIVQHLHANSDSFLAHYLNSLSSFTVKEAEDKEKILEGTGYLAPANYHLLIEYDRTLSLNTDERINYSRPSIDVLFTSAADVYSSKLIGMILTGANNDGVHGMMKIKKAGGLTIVQDPQNAEADYMPRAVIQEVSVDHILPLEKIGSLLESVNQKNNEKSGQI